MDKSLKPRQCACGCGKLIPNNHTYFRGHPKSPGRLFDLTVPEHAYMFGFIQADGHFSSSTRNRGQLAVELGAVDEELLRHFQRILPVNSSITSRCRDTNFKKNYRSVTWQFHDIRARRRLVELGLPTGKKCKDIRLPKCDFVLTDYFRGLIDGDGSLGLTKLHRSFISLSTSSDAIANAYHEFIRSVTGKLKADKRNKRDDSYNIVVFDEDAQSLSAVLYYEGCLALKRKLDEFELVKSWRRPHNRPKLTFERKRWSREEDEFICANGIEESMFHLNRTAASIATRLWRLSRPTHARST